MILVLEDRYESPLSIDTKKVPVALHLTSRFNDVRVTENLISLIWMKIYQILNFHLSSLILSHSSHWCWPRWSNLNKQDQPLQLVAYSTKWKKYIFAWSQMSWIFCILHAFDNFYVHFTLCILHPWLCNKFCTVTIKSTSLPFLCNKQHSLWYRLHLFWSYRHCLI